MIAPRLNDAYAAGLRYAEVDDEVEHADLGAMSQEERLAFRQGWHDGRRVAAGLRHKGSKARERPADFDGQR